MIYYLILLSIIILEWFLLFPKFTIDFELPDERRKIFLILVCCELILFTGFRNVGIGADTQVYLKALHHYTGITFPELFLKKLVYPFDFEIGYFFLTKLCGFLFFNDTLFLILIACLIYIPVFIFINDYSKQSLISVLIYFSFGMFEYSLGIFRQMIAISICLMAFRYILKNDFLKFFLVILIASLFHTTSLVMIPLFLISKIDLSKMIKYILPLELVVLFCARPIVLGLIYLFPKYSGYIGGMYDVRGGTYTMLILLNVIFFLSIYVKEKTQLFVGDVLYDISMKALLLGVFLQILGYSFGLFGRIVPYYSVYLLLLIPNLLRVTQIKQRNYLFLLIIPFLIFIFCFSIRNNIYILPFSFI